MAGEFLGVGCSFPIRAEDGRVAMASYEDNVRRAIWAILGTSRGERVMRPDFGCDIHELVFAVNDADTAGRAASMVRRALAQWEARIETLSVKAYPDPNEARCLVVEIEYLVRATNNKFNLVYPFYLE